jgi:hypothetical protein
VREAALVEQMAGGILLMQALHHHDDAAGRRVVEAGRQRAVEKLGDVLALGL